MTVTEVVFSYSFVTVGQYSDNELSLFTSTAVIFPGGTAIEPSDNAPDDSKPTTYYATAIIGSLAGVALLVGLYKCGLQRLRASAEKRIRRREDARNRWLEKELKERESNPKITFHFIDAKYLKDLPEHSHLPEYSQLKAHLRPVEMPRDAHAAVKWEGLKPLLDKVWVVSHRWETRGHPDKIGAQLTAIKEQLAKRPSVELVWIDFGCLPQESDAGMLAAGIGRRNRTREEELDFKW